MYSLKKDIKNTKKFIKKIKRRDIFFMIWDFAGASICGILLILNKLNYLTGDAIKIANLLDIGLPLTGLFIFLMLLYINNKNC